MSDVTDTAPKKRAERSPRYPFVPLGKALERAKRLHEKEGKNPVQLPVVAAHWGYQPKSSGVRQTIGALRSFGLLEQDRGGALKLTDRALRVIRDERPDSAERDALIREAALLPPMHSTLWKKYHLELPSDANLRHTLTFEEGFNPQSVSDFIAEYRATLNFAKMNSGTMPVDESVNLEATPISVGDLVSWESQGVVIFLSRKVTGFSEDGAWAFVEGSGTGIQRAELSLVEKAAAAAPKLTPPPIAPLPGGLRMTPNAPIAPMAPMAPMLPVAGLFNQDVYSLREGDAVLRWPAALSAEGFDELQVWLNLMLRKLKRSVVSPKPSRAVSLNPDDMTDDDDLPPE